MLPFGDFLRDRGQSFRKRLCLDEASGALGDLGTLIPLLAACAKIGSVRIGPAIFWMGIFNVISAVQWDIPMPVQPMKSIAAVAISDGMAPEAFAAAGVLTGSAVMILGLTQTIEIANKAIPHCVIAGMQLGLGTKMAAQGCSYWHEHKWLDGIDSKLTALLCLLVALGMMLRTRLPTALIIFTFGIILTIGQMVKNGSTFAFEMTTFETILPAANDWVDGFVRGALPQLPLTTLNSVVSVCALSVDLFGDPQASGRGATRASVASSVGFMNILGCWFGAMPSCHGAGGLAGQYKFGARGGMSILMLGIAKITLGLCVGQILEQIIALYPKSILGVLLLFAGVELASVGAKSLQKSPAFEEDLMPCFVTVGAYIGTRNMALGVSAGLLSAAVQRWSNWKDLTEQIGIGALLKDAKLTNQQPATDQHCADGDVYGCKSDADVEAEAYNRHDSSSKLDL
jgi:hypothetical protein